MNKIAVIGLGSIGMRHAKNLLAMGHKVYGLDSNPSKEKDFIGLGGEEIPIPMILENEVDAVVIATPTIDHQPQLSITIKRGLHCFVEKPIGKGNELDIDNISRLLKEYKKVLMVGNNLRFHACVQEARDYLKDKIPLWAHFSVAQYTDKDPYLRDGVISNWGAHELDLARYLLGPCDMMSCVNNNDKIVDIVLRHINHGCQTTVHLDYVSKPSHREFLIQYETGRFVANIEKSLIMTSECSAYSVNQDIYSTYRVNQNIDSTYIDEMKSFIDQINGVPVDNPGASGEDGLEVFKLIQQAEELGVYV